MLNLSDSPLFRRAGMPQSLSAPHLNNKTLTLTLKREASVLPILYNCGFFNGLWVTYDVTYGDLCNMLEN
jgi:hypothetical protein